MCGLKMNVNAINVIPSGVPSRRSGSLGVDFCAKNSAINLKNNEPDSFASSKYDNSVKYTDKN